MFRNTRCCSSSVKEICYKDADLIEMVCHMGF